MSDDSQTQLKQLASAILLGYDNLCQMQEAFVLLFSEVFDEQPAPASLEPRQHRKPHQHRPHPHLTVVRGLVAAAAGAVGAGLVTARRGVAVGALMASTAAVVITVPLVIKSPVHLMPANGGRRPPAGSHTPRRRNPERDPAPPPSAPQPGAPPVPAAVSAVPSPSPGPSPSPTGVLRHLLAPASPSPSPSPTPPCTLWIGKRCLLRL